MPLTPATPNHELFVPSDLCVGRYRRFVASWEARGWRIDSEAVTRDRLKVAYAIPCPARRETKGWVLDPVPLIPATEAAAEATRQAV